MILESGTETRDFRTIYKSDYYAPKHSEKQSAYVQPSTYPPPLTILNGPYKEHLNIRLPSARSKEDSWDNLFIHQIRQKYPHLSKFLSKCKPDEKIVERERRKALKTIYELSYSKDFDDYMSTRSKRTDSSSDKPQVVLPEDWVIPETIQRMAYRNPREMVPELVQRDRKYASKAPDNLLPNWKEREILRVTTGESEYGGTISATGEQIIREQLFGVPLPTKLPVPHVKGPDSVKSECSIVIATQKYPALSKVF